MYTHTLYTLGAEKTKEAKRANVCLICVPYMSALYVCLTCLPYMSALSVRLRCGEDKGSKESQCLPYMSALYVCLRCGEDKGSKESLRARTPIASCGAFALYVSLICLPYICHPFTSALHIFLICLPYTSALYVSLICQPSMSAFYVSLLCQPSMSPLHVCLYMSAFTCLPYMSAFSIR
jgi:hypothetical protein